MSDPKERDAHTDSLIRDWAPRPLKEINEDVFPDHDLGEHKTNGHTPTNAELDAIAIDLDRKAEQKRGEPPARQLSVEDFYCYMAMPNSFIFIPTCEIWPASSVNARIPQICNGKEQTKPSTWLATNRPVEQMTWAPGLPAVVADRVISGGGWIDRAGTACFNLYRPPTIELGDATQAGPWIDHVRKIYPDDADHIIYWLAQRVQGPDVKINHALVLGGYQGIGKDTLLEPVKRAVGPWNFEEVSPQAMLRRFNAFLKSVILRISEARDLGDVNRYQFYDHMKSYTAAPPDVLRVDEKHIREHAVLNVTGVIITTNHKRTAFICRRMIVGTTWPGAT
jgi:hypothetical protein